VTALDQLRDWPVADAAAAVVGRTGVLASAGDTSLRFRLASLTKPLTALAALVAVEEEAVTLADPLPGRLADELPGATLRHLLCHASGIGPTDRARAALPGSRRIYSNSGFDLVGEMVAAAAGIPFSQYLHEAVLAPLRMGATLDGSPASDGHGCVDDLVAVLAELMAPGRLLDPSTLTAATDVQFPGLVGVLPGFGIQRPNDWGLGFEIRGTKSPHWTSEQNSPATYGHFGQSGTMFWVDPNAGLGLVALADRDFGEWAAAAWPALSSAVLAEFG